MGITKRAQYKVFNGTDFDVINFESEADYQGIYRQALINGNFDVWQRGNSFWLSSGNEFYTADRWSVYNLYTGGTLNVTNENVIDLVGSKRALKCIYSLAPNNTNAPQISYSLENQDATKFAGQTVTISFKAKSFGGVDTVLVTAYSSPVEKRLNNQTTGATAFLYNNATTINSSSWTTVSVTTTVHDLSSMTINGNWGISISFKKSNGTVCAVGDGIMITQVQINLGSTRLPFSHKSFAQELQDCMRYFEKSYNYIDIPGSGTNSGAVGSVLYSTQVLTQPIFQYKVRKRITPTVTLYSTVTGASSKVRNVNGSADITYAFNNYCNETQFGYYVSPQTVGNEIVAHFVADAEF